MSGATEQLPVFVCPNEGCTAVQLQRQGQEELKEELSEHKARSTELFDRLFQRLDRLQWWLIGILGAIVVTLIAVVIKGG